MAEFDKLKLKYNKLQREYNKLQRDISDFRHKNIILYDKIKKIEKEKYSNIQNYPYLFMDYDHLALKEFVHKFQYNLISHKEYEYQMFSCYDFMSKVTLLTACNPNKDWIIFGYSERRNFKSLYIESNFLNKKWYILDKEPIDGLSELAAYLMDIVKKEIPLNGNDIDPNRIGTI